MRPTRRSDRNDFQFRIREEFIEVGVTFASKFTNQFIDRLLTTPVERMQFAVIHRLNRFGVKFGNHARSDNSELHREKSNVEMLALTLPTFCSSR